MLRDARNGPTGPLDPVRDEAWPAGVAALPATVAATPAASTAVSTAQQQVFEVTTLADVVDAGDGVVSLREAIADANAALGFDIITFADDLRGGTIRLEPTLGSLVVTDDLSIDGDPLDRGPDSQRIDGGRSTAIELGALRAENTSLQVEDLTVQNVYDAGIMSMESELDLTRVAINDVSGGAGISLWIRGGVLTMQDSAIEMSASEADAVLFENDADVTIADSMITVDGLVGGVVGTGSLELIRSTVVANGGEVGLAVGFTGEGLIDSSTISASGGRLAVGIRASGSLEVVNSTIVDVISGTDAPAGIFIRPDSTASIVNSTITGTTLAPFPSPPADPPDAWGIFIDAGSTASLANSIVDDSIGGPGTLDSNGANTFRDTTVTGAVAGDRLGVGADELFAAYKTNPGTTTLSGALGDNGGPTQTVALRDDPANPALDAADPAFAPPTDQRGLARDATPDIGAFEVITEPPPIGDEGLVVTTLADEVVVDGEVSLREAVLTANALAGPDTITFADDLYGGTIELPGGALTITDDVLIDADPQNRGPGGITIDGIFDIAGGPNGSGADVIFDVEGVAAGFADMTLRGGGRSLVFGNEADVVIARSLLHDNNAFFSGATGVDMFRGGSLAIVDSEISDIDGGSDTAVLVSIDDTELLVVGSLLTGGFGDTARGIGGRGDVAVIDSSIVDITGGASGSTFARGIQLEGNLFLANSLVAGNGDPFDGDLNSGIDIRGAFDIVNSTIANNTGTGIAIGPNAEGTITNSTLTGNTEAGLLLSDGTDVSFFNSIALGNGREIFAAGGGAFSVVDSLWGDNGFFPPPIEGLTADQVFAETVLVDGTLAGVLADNGGPTLTVALLDDPANPAVDAADPRLAPFIDQRGFLRDVAPDIGAFELGAEPPGPLPPLPPLAEKVPLADADIRGAPSAFSTLVGDDASIAFVDEYAAQQNSLGVYLVDPDGTIESPQWVFERVEHSQPSDLASELARPGGGPLSPGDAVLLSELFDPADLGPGVEFGLFLVADGATRNPSAVFDSGTLEFRTGGAPATVTDTTPQLVHIAENGVERLVMGDILHSVDAGSPNPLSNTLNPGGGGQVTSGLLGGVFGVAFEDKPLAESDRDFNDAIFAIDLLEDAPVAATNSAGAEVVAMDSLVTAAETV